LYYNNKQYIFYKYILSWYILWFITVYYSYA